MSDRRRDGSAERSSASRHLAAGLLLAGIAGAAVFIALAPQTRIDAAEQVRIDWSFRALQELPLALLALLFLVVGWRRRREANLGARWRLTTALVQLVVGTWICIIAFRFVAPPLLTWTASIVIGLAAAAIWIFVSVAMEAGFRDIWPSKLATLIEVFEGRLSGGALPTLRGAAAGLALLGADAVAIRIVSDAFPVRLDPINYRVIVPLLLLRNPVPAIHAFVLAVYTTLLVTLAAGLALPALAARVRQPGVILATGAVLLALLIQNPVLAMGAVQPWAAKMLFLLGHGFVLTWLLVRFDLLTVSSAAFTFSFVWSLARLAFPP